MHPRAVSYPSPAEYRRVNPNGDPTRHILSVVLSSFHSGIPLLPCCGIGPWVREFPPIWLGAREGPQVLSWEETLIPLGSEE
jgi:hypothetical protein